MEEKKGTDPQYWLNPPVRHTAQTVKVLCFVLLSVASLGFLFFPLESFQALLGDSVEKAQKYAPFALFALLYAASLCAMLYAACNTKNTTPPPASPPNPAYPRWVSTLQILLSATILIQVVWQMNMPFDLDENQRAAAALTKSFWHEINPFRHTEVHPISHFFSILSLKIFGASKIAFRIPSLLFCIAFLITFNLFARRFLSPYTTLLVLGHLCVNQLLIWYMHSMRGYISAMWIITVLLYCLYEYLQSTPSKKTLTLFTLFFVLSVFAHPFTGILGLLLMSTLVAWIYFHRHTLSTQKIQTGTQYILYASLGLPIFLAVFVCVLRSLEPIQNVHAGGFEAHLSKIYLLLPSLFREWAFRLVILIVALAGLFKFYKKGWQAPSFLSLLILNIFIFYGAVLSLLKVSHLEARWFIPFMIPFLIWIGEWIVQIPHKLHRNLSYGALLLLLTALPLSTRSGVLDTIGIQYHQHYDDFLFAVRKKTAPVSKNCYEFPDINMGYWARDFYFVEAQKASQDCQEKYVISLQEAPLIPKNPSEIILDHGNGYVAYRLLR